MLIRYEKLKKDGTLGTKSLRVFSCIQCNRISSRGIKSHESLMKNPQFREDTCKWCWRKYLNNRPEYKQKMSQTLKEIASNPAWRQKISNGCKGINLGDKNGMKKEYARKKVSATRKKMLANPLIREQIAEKNRKAWEDGKFDGVTVGKCKWFTHVKPSGEICKVQGKWELAYVKWLDVKGIKYDTHKGRLPYVYNGKKKNYYPDFYLPDIKQYIEIKNDYHLSLFPEKLDLVRKYNSDVKIVLLTKKDLVTMGVLND